MLSFRQRSNSCVRAALEESLHPPFFITSNTSLQHKLIRNTSWFREVCPRLQPAWLPAARAPTSAFQQWPGDEGFGKLSPTHCPRSKSQWWGWGRLGEWRIENQNSLVNLWNARTKNRESSCHNESLTLLTCMWLWNLLMSTLLGNSEPFMRWSAIHRWIICTQFSLHSKSLYESPKRLHTSWTRRATWFDGLHKT